jgi:hypothetical protein
MPLNRGCIAHSWALPEDIPFAKCEEEFNSVPCPKGRFLSDDQKLPSSDILIQRKTTRHHVELFLRRTAGAAENSFSAGN